MVHKCTLGQDAGKGYKKLRRTRNEVEEDEEGKAEKDEAEGDERPRKKKFQRQITFLPKKALMEI